MSTIYYNSKNDSYQVHSLIERKKLQWAKEKEELAGLNENAPWNTRETIPLYDRPFVKAGYVTKYQKETDYFRRDSASASSDITARNTTKQQHQQSLPPLYKNQNYTCSSGEKSDKEMGGETSGYGSDNQTQTPEHFPKASGSEEIWPPHNNNSSSLGQGGGYESSSSAREDRLKWDVVGKYWHHRRHSDNNHHHNNNGGRDTPGWVRRGLERDTELVVANRSPAESPEQDIGERPCTGGSSSTCANNRSYILGQNIKVDASELAERERKRQVAIQHQEAVRQQLEEREKQREAERLRKAREEYEEERRIAHSQELERRRQEQELQRKEEKEERERKRREALKEAIEIAEREAKEEKRKQRMLRQVNINNFNNNAKNDADEENEERKIVKNKNNLEMQKSSTENLDSKKFDSKNLDSKELDFKNLDSKKLEPKSDVPKEINSSEISETVMKQKLPPEEDLQSKDRNLQSKSIVPLGNINMAEASLSSSVPSSASVSQESLQAIVIPQNPLFDSLQNVQFVLIPTAVNQLIPNFHLLNSMNNLVDKSVCNTARSEERLLTPTQYRTKNKNSCDSSTQTDFPDVIDKVCEKVSNLEISYSRNSRRSKMRSRSEMRHSENEERPKWGVNKPPTRYVKQSEKDPLYLRRKLRQKLRQFKTYEGNKGGSSDESQTGSPRSYRKKLRSRERGVWRKDPECYNAYHTELVPLECDRDQIYYQQCPNCCRTGKSFRQLCCNCKCQCTQQHSKQQRFCEDTGDIVKVDDLPKLATRSSNNNSDYINEGSMLDKLTSIHNDLMLNNQDNWDGRNAILCSPHS